jgi:hypothetical protein
MNEILIKIFTVLFLLMSGTCFAETELNGVHWGIARDTKGKVVYTEKHILKYNSGRLESSVTEYYDADRKKIIAVLDSDYRIDPKKPVYEFHDLRSGYREGLRIDNNKYVAFRRTKDKPEEMKVITADQLLFAGQGWHYYLISNFDLIDNKTLDLSLILPGELDYFRFQISGSKMKNNQIKADLEISNWLLRMFAPSLSLVYDTKTAKLVEYRGVSNLLTDKAERQDVIINYEY